MQHCFLDQNPGENYTHFSGKDLALSENNKGRSQADASFAKRKAIMPKIAPTKKTKQSDFLSIYRPLLMKLSLTSQNKRSILMKQCLYYKTHSMILKMMSFRLFSTNNYCPLTLPSLSLPLNSTFYPPNSRDRFLPLVFLNPDILPSQSWQHYEENFKAITTLITRKPIGLIRISF